MFPSLSDHSVTLPSPQAEQQDAIPRRLAEFLIEFAVAVQKHAIYPQGHPQLGTAVDKVTRRLDALLIGQAPVSFGIARNQIVVDAVATDPTNSLMRELAQRLHKHRIGALRFQPGVLRDELADFLVSAAADVENRPTIALTAQAERWPHVELTALSYDKLELMGDDSGLTDEESRVAGTKLIWIALARATLMLTSDGEGAGDGDILDPAVLAHAIDSRRDSGYDQAVVGFLMQITEQLKGLAGEEASMMRSRVSDLVRSLQPETLERLVGVSGDVEKRKQFMLDASQTLAAEAVITLLQAAANASNQQISHTMLRLLGKLAMQVEKGGAVMRAGASNALRDQVESLVDNWDSRRLNPASYQEALDRISQRRVFTLLTQRQHPCEPKRMVSIAVEVDTLGAPVWLAVNQLITHGGIAMLLDLLDRAPAGNHVAAELWPLVATRENVRHLLKEEAIDPPLLERIAARMGLDVVELLLEALETTETRTLRRKLLDLLARFGPQVGPMVIGRLENPETPWYVQRNLLTLLAMFPELPHGFSPQKWMLHSDARVRREALKLLLRTPSRDTSIVAALSDRDDGIVQIAMAAALEACPAAAVPLIIRNVERKSVTPEIRALGIRVIGAARAEKTLDWLLAFAVTRTKLLHREKLLPKTPEMLAAIMGLASGWGDDPRARAVLGLAERARDADVRAAATRRRGPASV